MLDQVLDGVHGSGWLAGEANLIAAKGMEGAAHKIPHVYTVLARCGAVLGEGVKERHSAPPPHTSVSTSAQWTLPTFQGHQEDQAQ